jgi:hypothetical protein
MPFENSAGIGVSNFYGPRDTGGSVGVEQSSDGIHQLSLELTDATLANIGTLGPKYKMLAGAHILRAFLRVDEAFTLTGTTPGLVVGGAAPATNGIAITAAELAAVGTKIPASTGTGTWAANSATGTTATETVTSALTGTTPAVTLGAGRATLMVEFVYKNRPKPAV